MKTLPELHEWVLFSRMSPVQATLYSTLADLLQSDSNQVNPIRAFSMCCKVSRIRLGVLCLSETLHFVLVPVVVVCL